MGNDYTLLWDDIYDTLTADATLESLLGSSGRIGRGFAPSDINITSVEAQLMISDVDSEPNFMQADEGIITITSWASVGEQTVNVMNQVETLLEGYQTALAWTQQLTRFAKQGNQFSQGENLYFSRDLFKIPHRRI